MVGSRIDRPTFTTNGRQTDMWRGGVLSISFVLPLMSGCLGGPFTQPKTLWTSESGSISARINPGEKTSNAAPKPLSTRPNASLGWQVTDGLRIGAEIRHQGGSDVLIGTGFECRFDKLENFFRFDCFKPSTQK